MMAIPITGIKVIGAVLLAGAAVQAIVAYNESSENMPRGNNVRPSDEPVDHEKDLAGQEILGDLVTGSEDISGKMNESRYDSKNGTHDKLRGRHLHPDGTVTEVHADKNRETGGLSDTKFKGGTDNKKFFKTMYPNLTAVSTKPK